MDLRLASVTGTNLIAFAIGFTLAIVLVVSYSSSHRSTSELRADRVLQPTTTTDLSRYRDSPTLPSAQMQVAPPYRDTPPESGDSATPRRDLTPSLEIPPESAQAGMPAIYRSYEADDVDHEQQLPFRMPIPWRVSVSLPPGRTLSPRSMSMDARKGSTCTWNTDSTLPEEDSSAGRRTGTGDTMLCGIGGQFSP
ncbi:hypothetical protein GQ53DRAFT_840065 [Thozetella sp. PMI_491]|nr:hypothetical protein GQ53DRAFT_840065 [Thozetella sp. PMI_491]